MVKNTLKKIFKDWKIIIILFFISITLALVSFYIDYGFLRFINIISWVVLSFYLYKDSFGLVNLLDMSNDLKLWSVRILGGLFAFFGMYIGIMMIFFGLIGLPNMNNLAEPSEIIADPFTMGIGVLFMGLGLLGIFMVFRTKRRYRHIYVNK